MIVRLSLSPIAAMLALTACDPYLTTQYRQAITPLSPDQCVEEALRSSALIATVARDQNPLEHGQTSSYAIVVRDSATAGGTWNGRAAREQRGDSASVLVYYGYIGLATPPKSDRARWEGEAHAILEGVRARCAPNVPSAITCRGAGGLGGQVGACSTRA